MRAIYTLAPKESGRLDSPICKNSSVEKIVHSRDVIVILLLHGQPSNSRFEIIVHFNVNSYKSTSIGTHVHVQFFCDKKGLYAIEETEK